MVFTLSDPWSTVFKSKVILNPNAKHPLPQEITKLFGASEVYRIHQTRSPSSSPTSDEHLR